MRHRVSRLVFVSLCAAVLSAACGGKGANSPTAPSALDPSPSPAPPDPTLNTLTIRGRITETAPTSSSGVQGATVTVNDGSGIPKSVMTTFYGAYAVDRVKAGTITIDVSANAYVSASRTITALQDVTADFQLPLVSKTVTDVIHGNLDANVGTCSDGTADRPCNIVVIPVHNPGALQATLLWTPAASGNLVVTLFQTGQSTPIARSIATSDGGQQVTATVPGGANYEMRITYVSGSGRVDYTLTVVHQN